MVKKEVILNQNESNHFKISILLQKYFKRKLLKPNSKVSLTKQRFQLSSFIRFHLSSKY